MALEGWTVSPVDRSVALKVVVERHYLHRKAPCSTSFGLFDPEGNLRGVVLYGVPASVPLVKGVLGNENRALVGVLGNENRALVGELTRLWVDDDAPRNGESYLISKSIRHSGFPVIVSFADTSEGHLGIVYQASNWFYTGLSSKHKDWQLVGHEGRHSRHTWDEWGGIESAKLSIPERMRQVERPRKHRYVYINAKGARRKNLLALLKYPILDYPKGE